MAFNVSALTNYVDELSRDFILKTVYTGKTKEYIQIQEGIKGTQKLPIISNTIVLQAAGCGFSPQGTHSITQATITVGDYKVEGEVCIRDLNAKYTQTLLKAGATQEQIPFEIEYLKSMEDQFAKTIENKLWTASLSGGDLFDGFYSTITPLNSIGVATMSLTTPADVVAGAYTMVNNIPADIQGAEDLGMFVNVANFNKMAQGLMNAYPAIINYQNSNGILGEEFILPGTNVKVIKTNGLGTSNRFYCGQMSNFIMGVDLLSDFDNIKVWYNQDTDTVRHRINFRIGTTAIWKDQIAVSYNA